jgi:hypothetical protein
MAAGVTSYIVSIIFIDSARILWTMQFWFISFYLIILTVIRQVMSYASLFHNNQDSLWLKLRVSGTRDISQVD